MGSSDGLGAIRRAANDLAQAERRAKRARLRRDRGILQALAQRAEGDRPKPRYSHKEIGEAAGLREAAVRKIARER